jgi:hypothetical protein
MFGNHWAVIARFFHDRSEADIKNRFYTVLQQHAAQLPAKQPTQQPAPQLIQQLAQLPAQQFVQLPAQLPAQTTCTTTPHRTIEPPAQQQQPDPLHNFFDDIFMSGDFGF